MDELIWDTLVPACNDLNKQVSSVKKMLRADLGWIMLPSEFMGDGRKEAKDVVLSSVCDIDIDKTLGRFFYGIAHIPQSRSEHIVALNEAKAAFKSVIQMIRDNQPKRERNYSLAKLLLEDKSRYCRDPKVQSALKKVGFATLDLTSCYKPIRILPAPLDVVSWTWQARRREVISMTKPEMLAYANKILSGDALEITLNQVNSLESGYYYARVRTQNIPQLKSNYCLVQDGVKKKKWEMVSATNVFLTVDPNIPRCVFGKRPNGVNEFRKARFDKTIEEKPVIPSLNIHDYLPGHKRKTPSREK